MTSIRRAVSVLVVWGAATAFGLAFAAWTVVGPVLLTLVPNRHGIHAGDLIAFAAAYSAAAFLTWYLLRGVGRPVAAVTWSAPAGRRQH